MPGEAPGVKVRALRLHPGRARSASVTSVSDMAPHLTHPVRLIAASLTAGIVVGTARVLRGRPTPVFDDDRLWLGGAAWPTPGGGDDEVRPAHLHPSPEDLIDLTMPSWVEPIEGTCPTEHPVKANLRSGIFHRPGGLAYERTKPDRCYRSPAAAEADGLRAAKR